MNVIEKPGWVRITPAMARGVPWLLPGDHLLCSLTSEIEDGSLHVVEVPGEPEPRLIYAPFPPLPEGARVVGVAREFCRDINRPSPEELRGWRA